MAEPASAPGGCQKCRSRGASSSNVGQTIHEPQTRARKEYIPGDICAIQESPDIPLHQILGHSPPPHSRPQTLTGTAPSNATGSRASAASPGTNKGYSPRPCVVWKRRPFRSNALTYVSLMATFVGQSDRSKLSEILRNFVVPVSPHVHVDMDADDPEQHVHTHPEWTMDNSWIIAYVYSTQGHIVGSWKPQDVDRNKPDVFYTLDEQELAALRALCERKKAEWEDLIKSDPNTVARCLKDYQDSSFKSAKEKRSKMVIGRSDLQVSLATDTPSAVLPEQPVIAAISAVPSLVDAAISADLDTTTGDEVSASPETFAVNAKV
ncbi:hypothetical protein C8Q78DRAFT_992659 [Trametes maxima]|nr:hypothetical protein C8Q78DRAFT_992659 [Trametes maxima]